MDKIVDVKNFIVTIDNAIEPKICEKIIEKLNEQNNFMVSNQPQRVDKQWDGQSTLESMTTDDCSKVFSKALDEYLNLYKQIFPINCSSFFEEGNIFFENFKFQETPISGGFHNWHSENNAGPYESKTRFLAWSIFLNDVEEGGELEFLNYSMRIKPKKGSMVLFPAYFTHTHRGNPPISNIKYIATGWYRHFHSL